MRQILAPIKQLAYWALALCCLAGIPSAAADVAAEETAYRPPPAQVWQQLENDSDLRYEIYHDANELSLWDRFWMALGDIYRSIFSEFDNPQLIKYSLLFLGVGLLLYGIFRVLMAESGGGFKRKKSAGGAGISEENLHRVNLEDEIARARAAGEWRLLIRLQYLLVLKNLDAQKVIILKAGKTNHDYAYEIEDARLLHLFKKLSRLFEYTWYGGFEADERLAGQAQDEAREMKALL